MSHSRTVARTAVLLAMMGIAAMVFGTLRGTLNGNWSMPDPVATWSIFGGVGLVFLSYSLFKRALPAGPGAALRPVATAVEPTAKAASRDAIPAQFRASVAQSTGATAELPTAETEAAVWNNLRQRLTETALEWERAFGNAPSITSVLSELDAALLVGCSLEAYSASMQGATAVQRGYDFIFNQQRYQVKGSRPSGKPGSFVTLVAKATNYDWDLLVWVLYDKRYDIQEAWLWDVSAYRTAFESLTRLSPAHYRQGQRLA